MDMIYDLRFKRFLSFFMLNGIYTIWIFCNWNFKLHKYPSTRIIQLFIMLLQKLKWSTMSYFKRKWKIYPNIEYSISYVVSWITHKSHHEAPTLNLSKHTLDLQTLYQEEFMQDNLYANICLNLFWYSKVCFMKWLYNSHLKSIWNANSLFL